MNVTVYLFDLFIKMVYSIYSLKGFKFSSPVPTAVYNILILGLNGHAFFLFSLLNIDCGYSVLEPHRF